MSDTDATPSIEDIVREVMLKLASVVPSNNAPPPVIGNNTTVPNTLMEAIPEFGGNELGDDSNVWCSLVEEITKNVTSQQRLSSATHGLTGPAKRWYREWKGKPRTWDKFREDLCSVFVSEKRLHQRMLRAVTYTSDGAVSYAEYVRTKLMYFEQTRVNFKPDELIELVIGAITDESVRQAMMNGNHQTTASMIVGITQFGKTGCEKKTDKGVGERATKGSHTSRKRCFVCDSDDHVQRHCPKKAKSKPSGDDGPVRKIVTCSFCKKRGHEETRCWVKQRTANTSQEQKNAQANVCQTTNMKLTPILLRNTLLNCLMDSGANCSLMRESVAKRTGCNVTPFVTVVRGLGNKSVSTIAKTTAVVQCEDVSLELDIFILPDADVPYEVVIGRNVLRHPDLKMVTDVDGTKLQRTSTFTESGKYLTGEQCCTIDDIGNDMDGLLRELLGRYQHMIAKGNHIRSVTTGEMRIVIQDNKVINYRPYRLSFAEREKVREIITDLMENNIIRESTSPYASPILLVKKKNGKDRMCIDYRALNKITVKDRYPLPLIEDQLDRLGRGKLFTTLDMASGFYQIPVAADSIDKTAFITPDGHFEFLRMPFGLANAPAVFQRAINNALGNLKNSIAVVYIDDILIPSETMEEGLRYLDLVLHALSEAGFSLNMEKCKFFKKNIEYLGREISADGVQPSKEKVRALVDSPTPTNVRQVRQFMGLASYFRKFIPEFAVRTACISKLTKNGQPWCWGLEQEKARHFIIETLTAQPLLTIFDPKQETELHTDASAIGYGAILFQRISGDLRVIAYFSRRTTPAESRYHSYELETLAIVNALKYFRVYLLGINFKIVTDCNAVKATRDKKDLLPRVARWWVYLQDYSFDLEYRKGKCIEHVDYLSRNPPKDYRVNVICEGSWLEIAQGNDEETKSLIQRVSAGESVSSDFEVRNGILCRKILRDSGRTVFRSYVPKGSRIGLLRLYHDENCHVGYDKTFDRVAQRYWFPRMRNFVKKYIDHCITCTVAKRQSGPRQGFLRSIEKKAIPFDTVHCDCVGPIETSKDGYKHILIIVDAFTKYVQLVPLKTLNGPETLQVFRDRLTLFGTPRVLILDRGTNFTYKPLVKFVESNGVQLHFIATGAPRANGQAERYVSTITNLLTVEISKNTDWPSVISKIQLSLNTTVQKSTGFSPSRLLFGIERSAGNAVLAERELPDNNEHVDILKDRELASARLEKNAETQNIAANSRRRNNINYAVGDTVFVRPSDTRRAKLEMKYVGPYKIVRILPNDRFEIVGTSGRPQVAPKDRLRPWKGEWSGDENDNEDRRSADEPC